MYLKNFMPHEDENADHIADTFANCSDEGSEPDEVEFPIPPENGPNDVDINVIAEEFARGKMQPYICNKARIQAVKDHTGYDIPYQKAWYSLKMAREIVYGTWESSVQKLPKIWEPSKNITRVLPLAFAIVDDESYASWKWFLQQLSRHVIRGRRGVCLISDRHAGIIKAVNESSEFVPPNGVHSHEIRSLATIRLGRYKTNKDLDSTPMLSNLLTGNVHAANGINLVSLALTLKNLKNIGMFRILSWYTTLLFVPLHVQVEAKHHVFRTRWIGDKREQDNKPNEEENLQDNQM
ncbi:UNVERIFIED_CONTAM: hypothetical protein Sradi_4451400 [Sesamum radiatum]|uniref:MULE transposase domain-containing protein n=1 Tax=Sesamum radiatum TaxID=300843 RepID=A0AAW2NSL7_SESRA